MTPDWGTIRFVKIGVSAAVSGWRSVAGELAADPDVSGLVYELSLALQDEALGTSQSFGVPADQAPVTALRFLELAQQVVLLGAGPQGSLTASARAVPGITPPSFEARAAGGTARTRDGW